MTTTVAHQTAAARLEAARARQGEYTSVVSEAREALALHAQTVAHRIRRNVTGDGEYGAAQKADDHCRRVELTLCLENAEAELAALKEHIASLEKQAADESVRALEADVETAKRAIDAAAAAIIEAWPVISENLHVIARSMDSINNLARRREKLERHHGLNIPMWGPGRNRAGESWQFDAGRFREALTKAVTADGDIETSTKQLTACAPKHGKEN